MAEITDLLLLQQKLRTCDDRTELGYLVVNETARLLKYQTAVLWFKQAGGTVEAVSGLPEPVKHVPFSSFITTVCLDLQASNDDPIPQIVSPDSFSPQVQSQWDEFLPKSVVWIVLHHLGRPLGGILLAREQPWTDEECKLLAYWAGAIGHAAFATLYAGWNPPSIWRMLSRRRFLIPMLLAAFLMLWLPVSLSVNASAEVVPLDPLVVRAPIEGIIGDINVEPNQAVKTGAEILSFDDMSIRADLDVVRQELAVAEAEYQRASQAAVFERDNSSQLPMLKARVEQRSAQVEYSETVLERSKIYAERDGIVIISIASELEGKPIRIGEKLFTLAEPGKVEVEFWQAVGDAIPLQENAEVSLFLNVYPERVFEAEVRFVSYQAEVSPEGILAYRGRASLAGDSDLLVGWRGTAKLHGESVSVIYLLLRRPIAVVRQWLGV